LLDDLRALVEFAQAGVQPIVYTGRHRWIILSLALEESMLKLSIRWVDGSEVR